MKALLVITATTIALVHPPFATAREGLSPPRAAAVRTGDLPGVIASQPDLGVFAMLVDLCGLREELSRVGPYTILAPTDEAFQMLGEGAMKDLTAAENRRQLVSMLRYHIIPGRMEAASIRSGEVRTLQGSRVAINADASAIWIGRAEIMRPDIRAANGVIHTINMVMEPDQQ
jgi:uncharacterized surface protein with fasciclin (FAS1) repeats